MAECDSEQAAAAVLGYNEASWDNLDGQERLPIPARMPWGNLIFVQKKAVKLLGYTRITWDVRQTASTQPDSYYKRWVSLTACGECKIACMLCYLAVYCCPDSVFLLLETKLFLLIKIVV